MHKLEPEVRGRFLGMLMGLKHIKCGFDYFDD